MHPHMNVHTTIKKSVSGGKKTVKKKEVEFRNRNCKALVMPAGVPNHLFISHETDLSLPFTWMPCHLPHVDAQKGISCAEV